MRSDAGEIVMFEFMKMASTGASPEAVLTLFQPGAYVLTTLWTVCRTQKELRDYFAYFLVPGRKGCFRSMNTVQLCPNAQLVTGLWDWWVDEPDQVTFARYSAVVTFHEGRCGIKHLHSSVDPQS